MQITIENITPVFHPFIHEIESGNSNVGIYLKEGYVFSTTGAACTFFTYDDYENSRYPEYHLEQAIDRCLADELIQITVDAWNTGAIKSSCRYIRHGTDNFGKGEQVTTDQIVDHNPARLFRSGIVNHDYEVEIEAWIKVSKTYSVSAPNKETAKAVAMETAKGDNRNLQDRDQLIFSVKATDCKEQ